MIRKLITEMDDMSHLSQNEVGDYPDIEKSIHVDYGKQHDYAAVSAYAYLRYGKNSLTAGDREAIKTVYVTDETGNRVKLFLRGSLNPLISWEYRELLTRKIKEDLIAYLKRIGHKGFDSLMLYSVDTSHGGKRNDFADVLRECGFYIPRNIFVQKDTVTLVCTENDSEICILPCDQLMAITDDSGVMSAYLANCYLIKSDLPRLRQPPATNPPREYAKVRYCWVNEIRDAWNEYVSTL